MLHVWKTEIAELKEPDLKELKPRSLQMIGTGSALVDMFSNLYVAVISSSFYIKTLVNSNHNKVSY